MRLAQDAGYVGVRISCSVARSYVLTSEGELGKDEEVEICQILWFRLVQDRISPVQVVVDIANLRRELETADLPLVG